MSRTAYNTLLQHCNPLVKELFFPTITKDSDSNFRNAFAACLNSVTKSDALPCPENLDITSCAIKHLSYFFPTFKSTFIEAASNKLSNFFSTVSPKTLLNYPDFLKWSCPNVNENAFLPKAIDTSSVISRANYTGFLNLNYIPPEWTQVHENLRFRYDDIREKMLIVSSEYDSSHTLKPEFISNMLAKLAALYDTKYAVVDHYEKLCSLMALAAKTGEFTNVVILANGTPNLILVDERKRNKNKYDGAIYPRDLSCFSNLAPHGRITFFSCIKDKQNPEGYILKRLVQSISEQAQRVVIAPKDLFYPPFDSLLNPDEAVFYDPQKRPIKSVIPFYNHRILKVFSPTFPLCAIKKVSNVLPREFKAGELIYQTLLNNHLVAESNLKSPFKYLSLCQEDPRDKFLFFSSEYIENRFIDPSYIKNELAGLANRFDLKYKVVKTYDEICSEIEGASKIGNLKGVVLHSISIQGGPAVLDYTISNWEQLNSWGYVQKLSKCISAIDPEGAFVFWGGSIGSTPPSIHHGVAELTPKTIVQYSSLAQQMASFSERTVLAPVCTLFANNIHVLSTDPLIVHSPSCSAFWNYFNSCNSDGIELFQEYNP